eukprot:6149698-Prymnesium_polylepis.1
MSLFVPCKVTCFERMPRTNVRTVRLLRPAPGRCGPTPTWFPTKPPSSARRLTHSNALASGTRNR